MGKWNKLEAGFGTWGGGKEGCSEESMGGVRGGGVGEKGGCSFAL